MSLDELTHQLAHKAVEWSQGNATDEELRLSVKFYRDQIERWRFKAQQTNKTGKLRIISALADVDARTVQTRLTGKRMRSSALAERIDRVLVALELEPAASP
jgi:hypothetical protein